MSDGFIRAARVLRDAMGHRGLSQAKSRLRNRMVTRSLPIADALAELLDEHREQEERKPR